MYCNERKIVNFQSDSKPDEVVPKETAKETPAETMTLTCQQANDVQTKATKNVQSTLPTWLNRKSKPKIVHENLDLPKLAKYPKRTEKPTTPKRSLNDMMSKASNVTVRKLIDEIATEANKDNNHDNNAVVHVSSQSQPNSKDNEPAPASGNSKESENLLVKSQ